MKSNIKIDLPNKLKTEDIAETAIYTNVQYCKINFDGDHKTSLQLTMPIYPDVVFLKFANPFYTMSTFPLTFTSPTKQCLRFTFCTFHIS